MFKRILSLHLTIRMNCSRFHVSSTFQFPKSAADHSGPEHGHGHDAAPHVDVPGVGSRCAGPQSEQGGRRGSQRQVAQGRRAQQGEGVRPGQQGQVLDHPQGQVSYTVCRHLFLLYRHKSTAKRSVNQSNQLIFII